MVKFLAGARDFHTPPIQHLTETLSPGAKWPSMMVTNHLHSDLRSRMSRASPLLSLYGLCTKKLIWPWSRFYGCLMAKDMLFWVAINHGLVYRPAPSTKPATFQIGARAVGRTRYLLIRSSNFALCSFSCSHMCWMRGPTLVLPAKRGRD